MKAQAKGKGPLSQCENAFLLLMPLLVSVVAGHLNCRSPLPSVSTKTDPSYPIITTPIHATIIGHDKPLRLRQYDFVNKIIRRCPHSHDRM